MKVLHITSAYPTKGKLEDGSFIASQILSLEQYGIEVDLYFLKGKGGLKYFKEIFGLRRMILGNNFDLLHAHYMYVGWTARLSSKLPLIISFMGSDVLGRVGENEKYQFASNLFHKVFSNLLVMISSYGIVKSNSLATQFKLRNKIKVIPNGVDLKIFYPNPKITKTNLGLNNGLKYILFAGTPERKVKRFKLALKAVEILKNKKNDIELIYLKNKSAVEIAKYLNVCDCLLLTSMHEGSPNIIKEALACNLPIVSVNVGDVEERLTGVESCYLASSEPNDIAEKLFKALSSSNRANNGFEKVASLKIENTARKIISVYNEVISNN